MATITDCAEYITDRYAPVDDDEVPDTERQSAPTLMSAAAEIPEPVVTLTQVRDTLKTVIASMSQMQESASECVFALRRAYIALTIIVASERSDACRSR